MQKLFFQVSASLRRTRVYGILSTEWQRYQYRKWVSVGRPAPPPHLVKQMAIKEFAAVRPDIRTFVETGTYFGDMVHAVSHLFPDIYSVELSAELHELAQRRFAGFGHVRILQGDSGEILEHLLRGIGDPCLFWLDGHYSAGATARGTLETPIEKELAHIAKHPQRNRHVVLIDDARCFTGTGDYPSVDRLRSWAVTNGFDQFHVSDDIVRIFSTGR